MAPTVATTAAVVLSEVKAWLRTDTLHSKPPVSSALGVSLRNVLRRAAVAERKDRQELKALLKGRRQIWASSAKKSRALAKQRARGRVVRSVVAKRFLVNQRRCFKKPAAKMRPGPSKRGYDLRGIAPTPYPGTNVKILPQPVVNYLYAALADVKVCLDSFCAQSWFVHWGTLLGTVRDHGLMPWDFDCDVAVVVHSLPWHGWGILRASLERDGHQLYAMSELNAKVAPVSPYVHSLHKEYYYRAAERKQGLPMHALSRLAKQERERGCPVRKIGRNVVDIELVTPLHGQDLLAVPLVKAPVHRDVLLPTRIGRFGPLQVPVAHQATQLIRRLYGDEWATRICNGKRVPDCVPHVALPS